MNKDKGLKVSEYHSHWSMALAYTKKPLNITGVFQSENCEEYQAFPRNRFPEDPRIVSFLVGLFTAKLFTQDLYSIIME